MALFVPGLAWIVSVVGPQSVFATRQLLPSAFAFVVLVAIGLERLSVPVRALAAGALLAWTSLSTITASPPHTRPDWRAIADEIASVSSGRPVHAAGIDIPLSWYGGGRFEIVQAPPQAGFVAVCRPFECAALVDPRENRPVTTLGEFAPEGERPPPELRVHVLAVGPPTR